ncbi:MAG: HutD family protein, partial [Duodenibacillus sp.]|nr:HutD family protein [Duodenibacillus sp.]
MRCRVYRKSENLVHGWAGGETAEIFLHPEGSGWSRRDFAVRVSAAVTRVSGAAYSDFTGYERHIAPVEGGFTIRHAGRYERALAPYEVEVFDGGWKTSSEGVYTDFNLLTGAG